MQFAACMIDFIHHHYESILKTSFMILKKYVTRKHPMTLQITLTWYTKAYCSLVCTIPPLSCLMVDTTLSTSTDPVLSSSLIQISAVINTPVRPIPALIIEKRWRKLITLMNFDYVQNTSYFTVKNTSLLIMNALKCRTLATKMLL